MQMYSNWSQSATLTTSSFSLAYVLMVVVFLTFETLKWIWYIWHDWHLDVPCSHLRTRKFVWISISLLTMIHTLFNSISSQNRKHTKYIHLYGLFLREYQRYTEIQWQHQPTFFHSNVFGGREPSW